MYLFLLIAAIMFFQYRSYTTKKANYKNNHIGTDTKKTIEQVPYPLNYVVLTKSSDFDRLWD